MLVYNCTIQANTNALHLYIGITLHLYYIELDYKCNLHKSKIIVTFVM